MASIGARPVSLLGLDQETRPVALDQSLASLKNLDFVPLRVNLDHADRFQIETVQATAPNHDGPAWQISNCATLLDRGQGGVLHAIDDRDRQRDLVFPVREGTVMNLDAHGTVLLTNPTRQGWVRLKSNTPLVVSRRKAA